MNITSITNENTPAASGKDIIHASIEKKDVLAAYQVNSNKYIYSENINENQTADVKGSSINLQEIANQQQGFDNASLSVTVSNTLLNANTTDAVSWQELNNSTQASISEAGAIVKNRRKASVEMSSAFSDTDATGVEIGLSPKKLNKHKMTSENSGFVKNPTKETGKLFGEDTHQNEAIRTGRNQEKPNALLSDFKHWFKKSNYRNSAKNKKSQRTVLEEANGKDSVRKRKEDLVDFEMPKYKSRNTQETKDNTDVPDLLGKKDAFIKRTVFPALGKKLVYSRGIPRLKSSAYLNKDNIHRSIVKKNSDYDYPNFDVSNIFFNIDRNELQAYGADIGPATVANTQCDFLKNSIEYPQRNIPAQLNMIHIDHHVLSKTKCRLNEDNIERTLDNSEKTKIYKIAKFDSIPPTDKLDFMSEYGRKGSSHRNEDDTDVFKQVELEVLGLNDDSQYESGLLKNYSQSQVDDIFKKLYFEIFDIKEHRNPNKYHKETDTEQSGDRFFNKLNLDDGDDANEEQDMIDEQVDSDDTPIGYGGTKDCNDEEKIACQEIRKEALAKHVGSASRKIHNFNSVDFAGVDENWFRPGLEISGLNRPEGTNNVNGETELSFYITQECFNNITLSKVLKAEDIRKAQKNCTALGNNVDQNGRGSLAEDEHEDDLSEYISTTNVPLSTETFEYQTTVDEDDDRQEVGNETDSSHVDSNEMTHVNDSDSADLSSEPDDLDLESEHVAKYNFSGTTSEYSSSLVTEDDNTKNNVSEASSDDLSEDTEVDNDSAKNDEISDTSILLTKSPVSEDSRIGQSYENNENADSHFQNKLNPTPSQKNVLRIFVQSKCKFRVGKRNSNLASCLENNSKENVPATNKEAQQNGDNKDEIIMFSETGAENVSQTINPEAIVLLDGGATLRKRSLTFR